jgi:hypothetical protein
MKTKVFEFALIINVIIFCSMRITAQQSKPSSELPKYEVGIEFTTLTLQPEDTNVGVGGRFTYNLNRHLALEAAGYFLPGKCSTCNGQITGHMGEGLFGVKAGQRFKRFGIFGKVRPGFINYSKGFYDIVPNGSSSPFPFDITQRHRTDFAADLGGVLEIYPKKRLLLRFDAGTTFDRFGRNTIHTVTNDPVTGALTPFTFTTSSFTQRRFQFIAGVGFRF